MIIRATLPAILLAGSLAACSPASETATSAAALDLSRVLRCMFGVLP